MNNILDKLNDLGKEYLSGNFNFPALSPFQIEDKGNASVTVLPKNGDTIDLRGISFGVFIFSPRDNLDNDLVYRGLITLNQAKALAADKTKFLFVMMVNVNQALKELSLFTNPANALSVTLGSEHEPYFRWKDENQELIEFRLHLKFPTSQPSQ